MPRIPIGVASAPARIGLAVAVAFCILLAIMFAVRPDMMMALMHMRLGAG